MELPTENTREVDRAAILSQQLTIAIEGIAESLILCDADDRIIFCNRVFREHNQPIVEYLEPGTPYSSFLRAATDAGLVPDAVDREAEWLSQRLEQRRNPTGPFVLERQNGLRLLMNEQRLQGGGTMLIATDISELQQAKEALQKAHDNLERQVEERTRDLTAEIAERKKIEENLRRITENAERANRAKSEFLSSMSHELRTPMNAVLGFAQMLDFNPEEPLTGTQKQAVDHILTGGNHLLGLIDQVLELSTIEAGRISLNIDHIPLQHVIDQSLGLIQARSVRDGIEIIDQIVRKDLPVLRTDSTRLTQVLINLLSNAVKYNRPGGTVTLTCQQTPNGALRISVIDTGRGIPKERQKDLFKPFERLGLEAGNIEGTGIGLIISKKIIELLGGQIGFESECNKGSTFWIDVPQIGKLADSQKHLYAPPNIATKADRTNDEECLRKVLYVEDNPANMQLMVAIIDQIESTKLLTAFNAEQGLDLAANERPDLILMDINLPGMNGIEVLRQLKEMTATKHIPVIAITAAAMAKEVEVGKRAGFKDYITKPLNVATLIRTIEEILDSAKRPS